MTNKPDYRFSFSIQDQTTGETLIEDYTSLTTIDQFGACEDVEWQVARMLRMFRQTVRDEYERRKYAVQEAVE